MTVSATYMDKAALVMITIMIRPSHISVCSLLTFVHVSNQSKVSWFVLGLSKVLQMFFMDKG